MVPVGPVEGTGFQAPGKPSGEAAGGGSGPCVHSTHPVSLAAKSLILRGGL